MKNPKVRQIILPLITAMIWGSSFVTQSLSAGHLGCFSFNALRSIPAALALLLLLLVVRRIRPREKYTAEEKRALLRGGLICGFFLTLGVNLQQFGIETTTAGKAGFITTLYIVLVPVFSIMLGKKAKKSTWIYVLFAVAGEHDDSPNQRRNAYGHACCGERQRHHAFAVRGIRPSLLLFQDRVQALLASMQALRAQ